MPVKIRKPMLFAGKLTWGAHGYDREVIFGVPSTAFKYALGLRPRAREDEVRARELAEQNWAVLELISRDALATGAAVKNSASKDWQIHYDIDRDVFAQLFDRYGDQIVR